MPTQIQPAGPDLSSFHVIVVNSSGGKDSQTALREVVRQCDAAGVPRSRVIVSHQCLGRMEWSGTRDLVHRQAAHYGLRVVVSSYRNQAGESLSLLDYARKRKKWPSSQQRWCTSEFKRGPGGRAVTALARELTLPVVRVLNVYGFRADESPARARKVPFVRNDRFSTASREVWDWLPIHDLREGEVWTDIRASGVPYHPAYDQGMPRLSCVFCIFAPKAALMIAGRANPELLDEYCAVETAIGHTFQPDRSINDIRAAIQAGEVAPAKADAWTM